MIYRILDNFPYLQKYCKWQLDEKKMPENVEGFPQTQPCFSDSIAPAILHFCLSVMQELEQFLLFQGERQRPLVFFLLMKS